jgi:hypothetical protein
MYSHSVFQCQLLQQTPEEKNKEHFELLASITTIQAKTQYEVCHVQREQDSQVQKLREEALRQRKEREAILLHHQLSRTSHQPSGNTVSLSNAPVVTLPTTTNNAPPCSTSPLLAAHLLQTCPEEPLTSEAAKTKSRHILLGQYLWNFFYYYLVFMCR